MPDQDKGGTKGGQGSKGGRNQGTQSEGRDSKTGKMTESTKKPPAKSKPKKSG